MSSREDERRGQEGAAAKADGDRRKRRLGILAGVAMVAVAVVAALAIVSGGGDSAPQGLGGGEEQLAGQQEVDRLLAGIPQDGMTLGDPDAPVTVVEFVDLQCPFCAEFARNAIPGIVRDYVEPGDVKLELRLLRFLGDDSTEAAAMAAAAGEQDLMWQFTELFFQNQGRERSGYVTDEFLRDIAEGVDGLDVEQAVAAAEGQQARDQLARAEAAAATLGVGSTPSFFGGRGDGRLRELSLDDLTADALGEHIERLLPGG